MRALVAALRFLTRLPCPGRATVSADLPGAVAWFPLVGAGIGAAIGGMHLGLLHFWPATIAALLAVAVGLLLTGGFHEDAASDAADGLGGGLTRERVLEIMRDSRIGAYGAMSLWTLLTLRWAVLVASPADARVVVLFAFAGAWGRWTAAPLLRWLPSLGDGLGKDIAAGGTRAFILASLAMIAVALGAWHLGLTRAASASGVALAVTVLWAAYLKQRLGGQSGDLLGAGNQLVEASVLLTVLAA